mgnify:FL=1
MNIRLIPFLVTFIFSSTSVIAGTYNKSANGYTTSDGTVTLCFANFYKVGNTCHKVPENAYSLVGSTDWKCYETHQKNGNSCIKKEEFSVEQSNLYIPANAYASGASWQCIDGYKKKGYRCAKLTWKDGDYWDQEVSPGVSRISAFGAILTQMGGNNRTNTNFNTNLRNTSPKFKYRYGDQMYDSNNSFMGYIRNGVTYDRSMRQTGTIRNNNIYNNTGNYVVPLGQDYKPANATFDMTPGF